jgi:hypothetical protein
MPGFEDKGRARGQGGRRCRACNRGRDGGLEMLALSGPREQVGPRHWRGWLLPSSVRSCGAGDARMPWMDALLSCPACHQPTTHPHPALQVEWFIPAPASGTRPEHKPPDYSSDEDEEEHRGEEQQQQQQQHAGGEAAARYLVGGHCLVRLRAYHAAYHYPRMLRAKLAAAYAAKQRWHRGEGPRQLADRVVQSLWKLLYWRTFKQLVYVGGRFAGQREGNWASLAGQVDPVLAEVWSKLQV